MTTDHTLGPSKRQPGKRQPSRIGLSPAAPPASSRRHHQEAPMPCIAPSITKTLVRVGVLGAIATAGAVVVAGPDRVHALFDQTRSAVNGVIDSTIDDPIALRAQLRDLEAQYPEKIAEVRSDLSELQSQIAQLEREQAVTGRVVELTQNDLDTMQAMLAQAEAQRGDSFRTVRVRFDDRSLNVDEAYAKATQIRQLRDAYETRQGDIQRDLNYLDQQEQRLGDLLAQLETERAEFQTQLWQLDRQVDAIARNERMIDLMEKRERTIDEHSRYRVASLDQLQGRFADIRSQQEAELASLGRSTETTNYEDRAKLLLDRESADSPFAPRALPSAVEIKPEVIEITPEDLQDAADDTVASRGF